MTTIYCIRNNQGKHLFYVKTNHKDYYLFSQNFRKSNKEVFENGVIIKDINSYSSHHSSSVRKVVSKMKPYIHYIENEYGVDIYEKTKLKNKIQKIKTEYKREPFYYNEFDYEDTNIEINQ